MRCVDRLQAYFRAEQVPFVLRHHAAAFTAQEVAASEHVPGKIVTKVVIVFADGQLAMLALPASYVVDFGKLKEALRAQSVRLAEEREFAASFPDCDVGAMPPFGNLYGVPIYVDRSLSEDETIVFQAGTHTDTMSVRFEDFERLARPTVLEFARHH